MRNERPDHTLQTTALVNEAWLRIFQGKPFRWSSHNHFFCAMAQTMRCILVDHARECQAQERRSWHPNRPSTLAGRIDGCELNRAI
jgi:hypothetical protein